MPSHRLSDDPYRQCRKTGRKLRPQEEWIEIGVPTIVDQETWEAAQEQLHQNGLRASRNNTRHQYLLRGLVRCPRCGGAYTGYVQHGSRGYRCYRTDAVISSTGQRCSPGAFAAGPLEESVWTAVTEAMQRPELLALEYQQRLETQGSGDAIKTEGKTLALAMKRLKAQEDRVTDAYINEVMDLERYSDEMNKLRRQREQLERGTKELAQRERQQLLRLVVERITVEDGRVRIETIIPTGGYDQLRTRHPEPVEP